MVFLAVLGIEIRRRRNIIPHSARQAGERRLPRWTALARARALSNIALGTSTTEFPGLTNDTSNSKWRTPNPRPRSSPRARGRYRTTRRRPASTTLLRTSPSPRRYVRRHDCMGGSGRSSKRRTRAHSSGTERANVRMCATRTQRADDRHAASNVCAMDLR